MSQNVPNSFQVKFQNNVELVLQQQQSRLMSSGAVVVQNETGAEKVKIKDLVGNTAPREATDRHGRTEWGNRTYDGIWIPKPPELYDADLVDNDDELATAISLSGTATMAAAGTLNRAKDQRILEGFYGDVISGKHGTTTTAFPSGNIVPVTTGGASGPQPLNTRKLREAKVMLGEAHVDPTRKRFMVLTEEDNDSLLDEVPATSTDFQSAFGAKVDENGTLIRMLGFHFIPIELDNPLLTTIPDLATDANGYRKTPFWAAGGLVANVWQALRTEVGKIPELRFSKGYYAGTTLGATRSQAGMSGVILNQKR